MPRAFVCTPKWMTLPLAGQQPYMTTATEGVEHERVYKGAVECVWKRRQVQLSFAIALTAATLVSGPLSTLPPSQLAMKRSVPARVVISPLRPARSSAAQANYEYSDIFTDKFAYTVDRFGGHKAQPDNQHETIPPAAAAVHIPHSTTAHTPATGGDTARASGT